MARAAGIAGMKGAGLRAGLLVRLPRAVYLIVRVSLLFGGLRRRYWKREKELLMLDRRAAFSVL